MENVGTAVKHVPTASELAFNYLMFGVGAVVTAAFVYFLVAEPARLAEAWQWVGQQNLFVRGVLWLLFLPWMIALWMLQAGWAMWLRLTLVAGTLFWTMWLLCPWKA